MVACTNNVRKQQLSCLPPLTIPPPIARTPELISPSSISEFLSFCRSHGCAPPTGHEFAEKLDAQRLLNAYNPGAAARYDAYPSPTATILFTARDDLDLEDLTRDRERIKSEHARWLAEMQKNPGDHRVMNKCRYWREAREKLEQKVTALLDKKRTRRKSRCRLNQWASQFEYNGK